MSEYIEWIYAWISVVLPLTAVWIIIELFLASFFLNYKLKEKELVFYFLKVLPIRKLKYADIAEVKVGNIWEYPLVAIQSETHTSRIWGKRVFIKRNRGLIRWLAISPDNPDDFALELQKHF